MDNKNKAKFVSVVFPTIDRDDILIDSLSDVLAQDYPSFEIIVVDQTKSPNQKVLEFVRKNPAKIKYIHILERGSPNARNVAARNAKGELLLFFDDDIKIPQTDFIAKHVQNYTDQKVGLVGGRVVEVSGLQRGSKKEVGKLKYWGLKKITHFDSTIRQDIDHALGGNFSVQKKIFDEVGGFKTIYRGNAHLEETDFSLRVKRAGYRLVFEPKAMLKHLHFARGGNRVSDIYELRYWIARNHVVFILENYGKIPAMILALRQFGWGLLASLKRGRLKMFKVMWAGTRDGFKQARKVTK
jgi:GT2 family glycosyltransferase